jgi:hypothetical protein
MLDRPGIRLVRAGTALAVIDGTFSAVLSSVFYGSTVTKLFQGVASTLLGPSAMNGGTRSAMIGVLMHIITAFTWSTIFLVIAGRSDRIQQLISTKAGIVSVAAIYGPFIWLVMSLIVIHNLRHTPIAFTYRWWVQFFGHIPFVGIPIVASIAAPVRARHLAPSTA